MMINKKNCSFFPTIKYLRTKATRALYSLNSKLNIKDGKKPHAPAVPIKKKKRPKTRRMKEKGAPWIPDESF